MANHYNFYDEMLFGAFLATFVAIAPKYLMEFRLGINACTSDCMLSYACPGIWIYMASGMLISVLLIFSRCRRWHVQVQLLWIFIGLHEYLTQIDKHACGMGRMKAIGDVFAPFACLLSYLFIFYSTAYHLVMWLVKV